MEPFKEYFNEKLVRELGGIYARLSPKFDEKLFNNNVLESLSALELKERAALIMRELDAQLPADFGAFGDVILKSLHPSEDAGGDDAASFGPEGIMGFASWPVTDLITLRGIDMPAKALPLLKEITKRGTAEFAIRPFLDLHTDYTLQVLEEWARDGNRHVRRLVSEGTRPRLPWGMQLKRFVTDPAPILPLLEALKDDVSEYVRRSVANNLNDIAKDHPGTVVKVAADWLEGADKNRTRLVKHGCRTLIKKGDSGALGAFGYTPLKGLSTTLDISTETVEYGKALEFKASFKGLKNKQKLMIDYAIHFVKANGKRSAKVFKWKDMTASSESLSAERAHAIKPITTRVYYPGEHLLEIIINGESVASAPFILKM